MVLMGMDIPLAAIQRQIASAIDIIIHVGRLRDKSRKVLEIVEVLDYADGEIQTGCLYEFQETGTGPGGTVTGKWGEERSALPHGKITFGRDIRPHEYVLAVLQYAGYLAVIAWLYYESVRAFLVFAPGVLLYLRHWELPVHGEKEAGIRRAVSGGDPVSGSVPSCGIFAGKRHERNKKKI